MVSNVKRAPLSSALKSAASSSGTFEAVARESGFRLGRLGRPYATVAANGAIVSVRLSRIGTEILELTAESTGLERFDRSRVLLDVPICDLTEVPGRLEVVDEQTAVFLFDAPTVEHGRRLLTLAMTRAESSQLASIAPKPELIKEASHIHAIVRSLVAHGAQAHIRAESSDWILRPTHVDDAHIEWSILERGGAPISPITIETSGYSASYELCVLIDEDDGAILRTTLPRRIERVRRRKMPRVSSRGELIARFTHPTYDFTIERAVVDLSEDGLGVELSQHDDVLCPGLVIPSIEILRNGQKAVTLSGSVRSVNASQRKVGFSLGSLDPLHKRSWGHLVRELLHQHTRSWGYSAQDLWDLYEAAGYLNLSGKKPEHFAELKSSFVDATNRLAMAPEVGYHVLWPSPRGLDAASSNLLAYSRAHLGFQMAKRPGKVLGDSTAKEILRDLHWHVLEEALASSHSDWWIGYVQTKTRFSNLLMCEFQSRFRNSERECVVPVTAYQVQCSQRSSHDLSTHTATSVELDQICSWIQQHRPRPYWESQDFVAERIHLDDLKQLWGRVGLERERVVLVARERGQVQAAVIADLAHQGLHLYGLLDLARFFPLVPGGERHLEPLLEMAREWYAAHGRKQFVYFHELAEPLAAAPAIVDMGTANLCVISMDLIPDLLDYLFEHLSWDARHSMPPPLPKEAPKTLEELVAATRTV